MVVDIESSNIVNDERYGDNVVAFRARRGQGPARIRKNSSGRGSASEAIQTTMERPRTKARTSWRWPGGPGEEIRSRTAQRLEGTLAAGQIFAIPGLFNDHIRAVLEGDPEADSDADPASEPEHLKLPRMPRNRLT